VGGTAGAGGLPALGLLAPLERAELGGGVAALGAGWGLVGCVGAGWGHGPRGEGSASLLELPGPTHSDRYLLLFCLWNERLPQRRQRVCDLV
jgi:hypothetical protein